MSQVQKLRLFASQKLHAAVEEILAVFEETLVRYEKEATLSQEVISRQHALLCALNKPLMDSPSAEVLAQQNQVTPGPPPVSQEGGPPSHLAEDDIIQFKYSARCAVRMDQRGAEPRPVLDQEVHVVLSSDSEDTEDSEDYSQDHGHPPRLSSLNPSQCPPTTHQAPLSGSLTAPTTPPRKKRRRGAPTRPSCRVCHRTFRGRTYLIKHLEVHLKGAEPVCGLCGEVAKNPKLHLQAHLGPDQETTPRRSERQVDKPQTTDKNPLSEKTHTCQDCGRSFREVWKKRKHRCETERQVKT